jgi:hypothetical protein
VGIRFGKGEEKQRGHIDRCIDISIPRLFTGTAIAVGALQYTMVSRLWRWMWRGRWMWRRNVWKRCKFMMTDATQLACAELVSHYNLDMGETFKSSSDAGIGGRSIAMAGGVEIRSTICNHCHSLATRAIIAMHVTCALAKRTITFTENAIDNKGQSRLAMLECTEMPILPSSNYSP